MYNITTYFAYFFDLNQSKLLGTIRSYNYNKNYRYILHLQTTECNIVGIVVCTQNEKG